MEISFYHLTSTPIEKALPTLLEKAYEAGHRIQVVCAEEDVKNFDEKFWTFHPRKFLPHGTEGPEKQPVFITPNNDNQNKASVLAIADGREIPETTSTLSGGIEGGEYEKVLHMFDGNIEADLATARERWKAYKEKGYALRYWFQDEKGKWAEKSL